MAALIGGRTAARRRPAGSPRRRRRWSAGGQALRIPADLSSLAAARALLAGALEGRGWSDEEVGRALLAVQEALVNAVEHGSLPGAPIDVDVAVDGRRARVRVRGGRPGSASPSGPPAAPLPSQAHGRGRMIMEALAQRYDTRSSGAGTLVELVFARAQPERAGRPTGLDQLRQDLRAA